MKKNRISILIYSIVTTHSNQSKEGLRKLLEQSRMCNKDSIIVRIKLGWFLKAVPRDVFIGMRRKGSRTSKGVDLEEMIIPVFKYNEDKEKYLEQPIPPAPVAAAPDQPIHPAALTTYNEWVKNQKEITEEGQSVSSYVLKMKSYIDQLERLDHPVTLNLGVSLILVGLSKKYDSFVQNYNKYSMGKSVNELQAMLKLPEETLPKKVAAPALHAIRAEKVQKNKNKKPSKAAKGVQGKGKHKMADANVVPFYAPKPKNPLSPKDAICHHFGEGLRGSKKLNPGALSLHVGNGQREAVKTIGNYHLCLPSGLVIVLNNCHYAPFITRGIILVSRLYEDGFINRFELNNAISVSKNNVVYFTAIPRDGLYEIEIKKRIKKLQHDGLLNSTDIESLGKYVSCMSGKMARKPYSHQVERAKDLLGLIHTDVCGPFRIVSRQGANYFVTFIDDISLYGYVYLLKHKHEVFETFKVFQKEVKNQLEKTIKSLRSDRGGEYMSQEFLDHLKKHAIIAHRTPPYTPQHN
ncbi:retrotransposon protein, putative, ty1-copia subclass [Tanacetum coccineum]|uniref:Retrotransposon protein, putative, ty1-copia subclass n=1 Tax=Tanacetum coccineum TaxID=301880 RepID=A0ABQ5CJR5_9ASTR